MIARILVFTFFYLFGSIGLWAQGNASTYFNVYVPPNNQHSQSDVALVVTATADSTWFVIIDDNSDGDDDDSVEGLLQAGQSYVLYLKDNGINDDARYASDGEWKRDGDYFIVKSSKNVLVYQSTNSDHRHCFVPAIDHSSAGTKFIFYANKTRESLNDLNPFIYEDSTLIIVKRISQSPLTTSGFTQINDSDVQIVFQQFLNKGQDLIYSSAFGRDLLIDGHTYMVESSRPVTLQFGSLFGFESGSGSAVPSSQGLSAGELFHFAVPFADSISGSQEIKLVSMDNQNDIRLDVYLNGVWNNLSSWTLQANETASWFSGNGAAYNGIFRATCSAGKRILVFEASALESSSQSDFGASFIPYSEAGSSAGKQFICYLPPPSNQQEVISPADGQLYDGLLSHIYLYALKPATVVLKDFSSNGDVFSRTVHLNAESFYVCSFNPTRWNHLNNNGGPFLKIESDEPISISSSSASSAWSTFCGSSLEQAFASTRFDTVQAVLQTGEEFQTVAEIELNYSSGIFNAFAEVKAGTGLELLNAAFYNGSELVSSNPEIINDGYNSKAVFGQLPDYLIGTNYRIVSQLKVVPGVLNSDTSQGMRISSYSSLISGTVGNRMQQSVVTGNVITSVTEQPEYMFNQEFIAGIDTLQTDSWTCSCIDYNNDGLDDVFFTERNISKPNYLYRNISGNSFERILQGDLVSSDLGRSISSTWSDVDNDGDLDVIVLNNLNSPNFYYLNNGDGTFNRNELPGFANEISYYHGAAWVDYDNDGNNDLYLSSFWSTKFNELWNQQEDGSFQKKINNSVSQNTSQTVGATWADYNNDGFQDLFIPGSEGALNLLFRNKGNGQFEKITDGDVASSGGSSVGSCWGDIDNDGDLDLFVANSGNQNNDLFINQGNGILIRRHSGIEVNDGGHSHGCSFADIDNDADLDLYVTNDQGFKFLYINDGSGNFSRNSNEIIAGNYGNAFGHAWCDTDNDGDLDLFVATHSNQPNYFFTNNGNGNHWLKVKLQGVRSNRSAIGARVRILSNGIWQTRELNSQSGFGGQSSLTLHFGLGASAIIDSVQVKWPGGHTQKMGSFAADQILNIVEENTTLVSGIIFADLNGNCLMDAGEPPIPNYQVQMQGTDIFTVTNDLGEYSFYLPNGIYNLALNSTEDLSIVCDSLFPLAVSSAIATLELVPLGLMPDCIHAEISVIGFTPALRRGFDNLYQVQLINNGYGTSQNNMLYVTFPAGITVQSTMPTFQDSLSVDGGGTMFSFQIPAMQAQQIINLNLIYYVGLELNIGDFITITSALDLPGPDCNPDNNLFSDVQEIMGAFDPNDLLAWPEGSGKHNLITADQRITYRVRFQNVGNYVASHVTLHDIIPEALDPESISGMHASHPYFVSIHDNVLKVEFRNIYLPDSSSNQEASNGYFEFDIAVREDAPGGAKIVNQAGITFDFNEPIYTNETLHTLVRPENTEEDKLVLFPNPTNGEFFVLNPFDGDVILNIYSVNGNSIQESFNTKGLLHLENLQLNAGFYVVELISSAGGRRKTKLIVS